MQASLQLNANDWPQKLELNPVHLTLKLTGMFHWTWMAVAMMKMEPLKRTTVICQRMIATKHHSCSSSGATWSQPSAGMTAFLGRWQEWSQQQGVRSTLWKGPQAMVSARVFAGLYRKIGVQFKAMLCLQLTFLLNPAPLLGKHFA